ncbi:hypothetical protein ARMGADRAFT_1033105 [Armillaria gallica]|uniref:Uncharacterized protein n=1 Tax=Armillaria gallica TaxID=47427 RepID=A0A2H3D618_ARMGA|nr:hypothetical protein ARMGADRAFT_1033105 [Armillaria gallica]
MANQSSLPVFRKRKLLLPDALHTLPITKDNFLCPPSVAAHRIVKSMLLWIVTCSLRSLDYNAHTAIEDEDKFDVVKRGASTLVVIIVLTLNLRYSYVLNESSISVFTKWRHTRLSANSFLANDTIRGHKRRSKGYRQASRQTRNINFRGASNFSLVICTGELLEYFLVVKVVASDDLELGRDELINSKPPVTRRGKRLRFPERVKPNSDPPMLSTYAMNQIFRQEDVNRGSCDPL